MTGKTLTALGLENTQENRDILSGRGHIKRCHYCHKPAHPGIKCKPHLRKLRQDAAYDRLLAKGHARYLKVMARYPGRFEWNKPFADTQHMAEPVYKVMFRTYSHGTPLDKYPHIRVQDDLSLICRCGTSGRNDASFIKRHRWCEL